MATVGERLVLLEAQVRDHDEQLNGGGDVDYTRSVRGRLHTLEGTLAGIVLRRNFGQAFGKGWVQAIIVLAAVATASAAWYAVLTGG